MSSHIFGIGGIFMLVLYFTRPEVSWSALMAGGLFLGYAMYLRSYKKNNKISSVSDIAEELEVALEVASYICKRKVLERLFTTQERYPDTELKAEFKEYFIMTLNKRNNNMYDKLPESAAISVDDYVEFMYISQFRPMARQVHKDFINSLNNDGNASN